MAAFNSTFQTDLAKPSRVVPIPDTYTRGDNESHTITVLVYDSENPSCGLMAGSVSAAVARQDGNTIPLLTGTKGAATVPVKLADGSTAQATPCTITLTQACFDCPGQVVVVIRLVSGETITSIFVGSGKVNAGLTNSIIDPGDVITDITALIAAAEQAAEDAETALAQATAVVSYAEQTGKTDAQKAQARTNIGAASEGDVTDLRGAFHDILVSESPIGDPVTLTNILNCNGFYSGVAGVSGLSKSSFVNGVATFSTSGTGSEKSPYIYYTTTNYGEKNWIVGFKYRITKPDASLGDPEDVRIHLGSQGYTFDLVLNEWIDFSEVATIDLTRIRFALRNFATVPVSGQYVVEIKEMYVYDATDVSAAMCAYIVEQQSEDYTDGTVTYGETSEYSPDPSLEISGKAADSKAVGDALSAKISSPTVTGTSGQVLALNNSLIPSWQTISTSEIDDEAGEGDTDKAWSADKLTDEFGKIQDSLDDILVYEQSGEIATLTNAVNISGLYTAGNTGGFSKTSIADGVATYTASGGGDEKSPYIYQYTRYGEKKWIFGFKYKLTKLIPESGDPQSIRILAGKNTASFDYEVVWDEWIDFAKTVTVDFERIYFTTRLFETVPASGQFKVEMKDMYVYDATGVSDDLCEYIMEQQSAHYTDGQVTYDTRVQGYYPDKLLEQEGKAADAKAVGDAIHDVSETLQSEIDNVGDGIDLLVTEKTETVSNESQLSNVVAKYGLTRDSISGGIATFVPSASPNVNPAVNDVCDLGEGKWLVGFKYRITKLDQNLGDPKYIQVTLGADEKYYNAPNWGEWINFAKVTTVDLTRIYFCLYGFSTAPTSGQLKLEIADYYIYDVENFDDNMIEYIASEQRDQYTDGTVTYSSNFISDNVSRSFSQINVKNYGVKGDGVTDDTEAIRFVFSTQHGNFYFPAGTYVISGTIEIPAGSTMFGDGDSTVINMVSGDDLMACEFRGSDKIYPYILVRHENTVIRRIKVVGNNILQTKRHGGICILDTYNCSVEDATVYNINFDPEQDFDATVSGYGICVTRSQYVNVLRCNSQRCGYECIGIVDHCDCCTVRDCYTKDGWRTCIQVHRGSDNTTVENCYMVQSHTKWDACFTVHGLGDGAEVNNLRVVNCTAEVQANGAQPYDYCAPYQIMSYAKSFWFIGNRVSGGKRALYISNSCDNAKVIGNDLQCNSTSDYGIKIISENAIIVGNSLKNEMATPTNVIDASAVIVGNYGI